ncbi:MAG: hypothetical protein R3E83_25950 [Burkholderiaceae bacterium]
MLTDEVATRLLESHAPVIEVLGGLPAARVVLSGSQLAPEPGLDLSSPTIYSRLEPTRFAGSSVLQLVYSAWFGEPPRGSPRSLYLRLTIDSGGELIRFEAMAGHGGDRLSVAVGAPGRSDSPADASFALPGPLAGQRLRVLVDPERLAVLGLDYVSAKVGGTRYELYPEDILRSLPIDGDPRRRASLYDSTGLMRNGVAESGSYAPHQWGHHRLRGLRAGSGAMPYFDSPEHRRMQTLKTRL